jgi:GTP pyrophosphokinase
MVAVKQKISRLPTGEVDLDAWLAHAKEAKHISQIDVIKNACLLAKDISKGLTTFYGQPCLEQGLEMAEIMLDLKLDHEATAAAILLSSMQHTQLPLETIHEKLGDEIAKLIRGVQQMDAIHNLQKGSEKAHDQTQIDRLRKLLLSMVSDIRVVLIKLAERTCIMRNIKGINPSERKRIAEETMDIYAPLANRLGIGQLKWELEDVAFHYIDPVTYKNIAKFLAERRVDREYHIQTMINHLKDKLAESHIKSDITGRAKHIYSIYLKTRRKDVDYKDIYDCSAIRVLVPTLQDCYTALSIAHNTWEHIAKEFDDYIAIPKPNGYRSIHTAVIGPDGKIFEIQIRTMSMHEEAERGVAAHWIYKEGKSAPADYEAKIVYLRQLLDWHRDVANQDDKTELNQNELLMDRVYVFTPGGDILDLPNGATPLDFAYHVHSQVGDRCRGAKINGHIVPLTYTLRTGDQVEILTNPQGTPSRDWLNSDSGYLKTPRAKAKVAHWFRQQDFQQHVQHGRDILEREFSRTTHPNLQKLTSYFDYKDEETFLAALGRGNIRMTQILHAFESQPESSKTAVTPVTTTKPSSPQKTGMNIAGVSDLLTRIARCCKPIPGDEIVGFITQGQGVTIHKKSCNNVLHLDKRSNNRLIQIAWDPEQASTYYVDLQIRAQNRDNLLKEVTTLLSNAKVNLMSFNSTINRNNLLMITLTVQIHALSQLKELINQVSHLSGVIEAKRITQ